MKKLALIPILLLMLLALNGCSNKKSFCECMNVDLLGAMDMTGKEQMEHCGWIAEELTPNEISEKMKDCK